MAKRIYPAGVQSFESIRKDGYVYVDKTQFVYKMITEGKPYFLSRPRRFGKSLLISTLAAVFEGRKDLFEAFTADNGVEQPALFIAQSDWKWDRYPVFRFDFSSGDLYSVEKLDAYINQVLGDYESLYGITPASDNPNLRIVTLLRTAHRQTGRRCVVLVDEYDNFILHALGDAEKVRLGRSRFQDVFGPLKAEDDHLQFVFITGISKFSQMGIFSRLNNLTNISMVADYDAVCGISEEELTTCLKQDIEELGRRNGMTYGEQLAEIKRMYDGYHFSKRKTDIYNPFSLTYALKTGEVSAYWFDRGTSGALIEMLAKMPPVDMAEVDGKAYPASQFDLPFESFDQPISILYQSGYLTIQGYDREFDEYVLGFPNREVRKGFAECLYRYISAVRGEDRNQSVMFEAYKNLSRYGRLEEFIGALRTFFAGIPYHLENRNERHYHALLYTLLVSFGADIRAEEPTAMGRADLVLKMPKGIYIFELKYDGTADEALAQIEAKGYAAKYAADGRPITKVGISFSSAERNITDWIIDS